MRAKIAIAVMTLAGALEILAAAQSDYMRAQIKGGGGDGKCTFEVEVDGVAEVQIRGDEGYLRTISGNPGRWRRLECNQTLPTSPNHFQFKGVDGRGRQSLVRDPNSNRGVAVIRIEDPKGGSEGYTGDILWQGGFGTSSGTFGTEESRGAFGDERSNGAFGDSSSSGWGGQGWNDGWGDTVKFDGRGLGSFDRDGGPRYDLRGVSVKVDRSSGRVSAIFDTDEGRATLSFIGRITRVDSDTIEADLVEGNHRAAAAKASGRMRIRVISSREVRSINIYGDVDNRKFHLDWRN
jgi:hypothetical protein